MSTADKINIAIVIVGALSAFIALAYTVVTFNILKVNRAAVEAMRDQVLILSRPRIEIVPFIRPNTQLFALLIKNAGNSTAQKLRLHLDRDFYVFGENQPNRNLAAFAAFSKTIESFPPGAEMHFYLGTGPELYGDNASEALTPLVFSVKADFEFNGKRISETTNVDLTPYRNSAVRHDPIVQELEKIRDAIDALRNSMRAGH